MRTPLVAGNWKMHKTVGEALRLVDALLPLVAGVEGVEVAVAPPFTALHAVGQRLVGTPLRLAGQNMHWEAQGAYTGEVSAAMLAEAGCAYVILGHSERRQLFGETDAGVGRKVAAALAGGLTPVVCVGETLEERDRGAAFEVVERQIRGALGSLGPDVVDRVAVAYEPVWAIGTGRTATAAQAQEVHAFLRQVLGSLGGTERAGRVRLLYGGSVKPYNSAELLGQPDVDGALVGGASLEPETFASIVRFRV
ncbi:MAG: triose-phosphate isomerase [Deltaproteobacteria bacterium]|nr:triose-phosphate isomerase [Deltaproteobacteria bacterium]